MRENIGLFRGKRKDNGEWVEGDLKQHKDLFGKVKCMYIEKSEYDLGLGIAYTHDRFEVLPETVGEYKGFPDKFNKKIFKGDLISGYFKPSPYCAYKIPNPNIRLVDYDEETGSLELFYTDGKRALSGYQLNKMNASTKFKIIGNIFDNPEMIGEVK